MAESPACLVRSFSQPSHTSRDYDHVDPLQALTTSISFGRFMTESLDWEKRSAFTQNRNLEEIKNLSKLGTVAQKKAYFEAHYKRIAAKKKAAAALLKQGIQPPNHSPEPTNNSSIDFEFPKQNSPATTNYMQEHQSTTARPDIIPTIEIEVTKSNYDEEPILVESKKSFEQEKTPIKVEDAAKKRDVSSSNKKKHVTSSSKSSSVKAANVQSKKDDRNASESEKKKKSFPKSLHMSINLGSRAASETIKTSSPILNKIANSRIVKTLVKASVNGVPKNTSFKPQPENKRTETMLHCPVSRRKAVDGNAVDGKPPCISKLHLESSRASCATKTRSPIVPSSFSFKSDERAEKRKEFFRKLEENAEAEKARVLAKSKIPPTKPCSSKLGRKPSLTINQDACSRPPWKSSVKNEGSKTITDNKNKRTTTHSRHTLSKKNTRENASPNIPL